MTLGGLSPGLAVGEGAELAVLDAVEAVNASAVVNLLVGYVNAGSLALLLAGAAAFALVSINDGAEHCEAGEEAERRSHRAHGVAICAAANPGKDCDNKEGNYCNDDGSGGSRGYKGAEHPSVGAVRCQKGYEHLDAGYEGHYKENPDPIAEPFDLFLIGETHLFAFALAAEPGHDVLIYAHRAYD